MKYSIVPKDVFRSDAAARADAAIVVGTSDSDCLRHRIEAGIQLFQGRRVPRLILTGDGRKKHSEGRSEAARMRDVALQAGVPADALFLDEAHDDLAASAKELGRLLKSDAAWQGVRSIVMVSSAWHLLRLFILMRRHLPHQCLLTCHPASEGITASNWQTSPQGRAAVENELRLIEKLLKTGYSLK
jgi:vancomycin permeability regulator SanA